jgi:tripartite-type tricarboxylate transporter receptor subunit TctC
MMRRRTLLSGMAAAGAWVAAGAQTNEAWPKGPVRILVGFPPGGGTDILARHLGSRLSTLWNQPVVIENKSGAAGVIAAGDLARQAPDGMTLMMGHINALGIAPGLMPKLAYQADKDFSPITMVGQTPQVLVTQATNPVKSLSALIALLKQKPGQVAFGSAGAGSAQHLALALLEKAVGVDALHVPYRGSAPVMTDLLGGQISYAFEGLTTATPMIKSGKLVALAQTLAQRSKAIPDVPTVAEQGLPGFEASIWFGLVAPGRMPEALVKRLNADVNKVLAQPDMQAKLAEVGAEGGGGSAERFGQFMVAERRKWAQLVRDKGITPED